MTTQSDFIVYLMELVESIGGVKARAMFGLVSNDTLYLKVDEENRRDFESRGLKPFTYRRGNRENVMSYYQAPDEALDNAEVLNQWVQRAVEAAVRSSVHKRKRLRG
ncbi:TfoX/Sxy family protein [Chloroflexota bacterium]